MKVNLEELKAHSKYINERYNATGDLIIWNYNAKCQCDRAWDQYTLMARGLITDLEGTIIARPFKKFFNLGEQEETMINNLPNEIPVATEKMDGSLGILYHFKGKPCIATRGSFNSDQALWATDWIQKRYKSFHFDNKFTYLFEIIYPENRVIVDYGDTEELVLLSVLNIEDGKEYPFHLEGIAYDLNINCTKEVKDSIPNLLKMALVIGRNNEGYVLKYSNGLRVKIKGEEYKRLHKLITSFSSISIWECLKNETNIEELIKDIPDEYYQWIKKQEKELKYSYRFLFMQAGIGAKNALQFKTRKEQAKYILKTAKSISGLVFSILDGKFKPEMIWKMIRPEFKSPLSK